MGLLDALKGLLPKGEPFPWDAQSIRHPLFTLRLPDGWRFTQADWRRATVVGPAQQAVELYYNVDALTSAATPQNLEWLRKHSLEMMRMLVKHDAGFKSEPTQSVLPSGILWTEASETRGGAQWLVVYVANLQPRGSQYEERSAKICLRTSVSVAIGALGAERLETLRDVLRKVEWN